MVDKLIIYTINLHHNYTINQLVYKLLFLEEKGVSCYDFQSTALPTELPSQQQ